MNIRENRQVEVYIIRLGENVTVDVVEPSIVGAGAVVVSFKSSVVEACLALHGQSVRLSTADVPPVEEGF